MDGVQCVYTSDGISTTVHHKQFIRDHVRLQYPRHEPPGRPQLHPQWKRYRQRVQQSKPFVHGNLEGRPGGPEHRWHNGRTHSSSRESKERASKDSRVRRGSHGLSYRRSGAHHRPAASPPASSSPSSFGGLAAACMANALAWPRCPCGSYFGRATQWFWIRFRRFMNSNASRPMGA